MSHTKELIHIAVAADNNFAQHLCVTLVSVFANLSTDRKANVYILDGGITEKNSNKIRRSLEQFGNKVNDIVFMTFRPETFSNFKESGGITKATYYRINLPTLLPDVSKVLYLDSDIVVMADIGTLYDVDVTDTYMAAIQDSSKTMADEYRDIGIQGKHGYFNNGVALMNLDKFRANGTSEKVIDWLEHNNFATSTHDQVAINAVLAGDWKPLSPQWNQSAGVSIASSWEDTTYTKEEFLLAQKYPKIIHYTSRFAKPWKHESISPHKKEYYIQLAKSEFSDYRPICTFKTLIAKIIMYIYFRLLPSTVQSFIKHLISYTSHNISTHTHTSHETYYKQNTKYSHMLESQDAGMFAKYIDIAEKFSSAGDDILDVGCGTGVFLESAKTRMIDRKLVGVDISTTSIAVCKDKGLQCHEYDGKHLPFADSSFDIVGSLNVLEHVDNPEEFLGEQIRVLRHGGRLILACPNFLSITNNYHHHTSGFIQKTKNIIAITKKFFSREYNWAKMQTIERQVFQPDDDACNVTNPIDILKWARMHNLKRVYWSSQIIFRTGLLNFLDQFFIPKILLGSSFMVFRRNDK